LTGQKRKRLLVPDAVPTKFSFLKPTKETKERETSIKRAKLKARKEVPPRLSHFILFRRFETTIVIQI